MADVITLGEAMVTMTPVQRGPLRFATTFQRGVGGAELNYAIGIARLGGTVRWLSLLGDDEFGRYILHEARGEGIDTTGVALLPGHPTGLNVKEVREGGGGSTFYYRKESAASLMTPEHLRPEHFAGARWLHVSGVFAAVSPSARATVYRAIELARAAGLKIALDPNIRLKLWDAETARTVLLDLVSQADYVLPGQDEGHLLFGSKDPDEIAKAALSLGCEAVVVKEGPGGATGYDRSGLRVHVPGFPVHVVDTVGAGDGWAAGFTMGVLRGCGLAESIGLGNAVGAMVCTVTGDSEGLPRWDEVQTFRNQAPPPVER